MTSKQRVRTALEHRAPDRVPLGEIEIDSAIVEAVLGRPTYYRAGFKTVMAYLDGRRDEVVESMKRDYVEFIRKTEMDIVSFAMELVPDRNSAFLPLTRTGDREYMDRGGNRYIHSQETGDLVLTQKGATPSRLIFAQEHRQLGSPKYYTDSELEFVRHVVKELGSSHFVVGSGSLDEPKVPFRDVTVSLPEELADLMAEGRLPDYTHCMQAESGKARLAAEFWKAEGADAVWDGQDIGCNQGTFLSPEMCRTVMLPGWRTCIQAWHAGGLPCIWHSCGNNRAVWDQFVEAGADAYQSIQEEEPLAELKRLHGDRLSLMGGVSCRLLDSGTPQQVREQVKRAIDAAAAGGGFILSSSHSLHRGVNYENFMAMLEAWHDFR